MKLIVGLGNPGKKYQQTRHNVGFRVVERLGLEKGVKFYSEPKFKANIALLTSEPEKVRLVQPLTYMNASGEAVSDLKKYYKYSDEDIVVVHDDIDLPLGKIRVSKGAGTAGHRGIESILGQMDKSKLNRIRIGIENRKTRREIPTEIYVLQKFTAAEETIFENKIIPLAIAEIKKFLSKNETPQ
jgi:PTH1 family peptidyl-tRNA hydrolase